MHDGLICANLTVTGDSYGTCLGSYIVIEEKTLSAPEKPVYKLEGQDRYIFNVNNGDYGWFIGPKYGMSGPKEGHHYFASMFSIAYDSYGQKL